MSTEQMILYMMSICACCYFSFKAGFDSGASDGIDTILSHLEKIGYIKVDKDGNISRPSDI
jgi:hypothetical protein